MPAINFDTLAYAKEMEAAGFTREQADAFATAQGKILKDAFAATELATRSDVRDVRDELKEEIANTKHEILKWVMGIALAQTAALVAVIGVAIVLVVK